MTAMDPAADIDEQTPLLPSSGEKKERITPLPKVQLGVLMLLQLAEPITSQCIYPFINQVCCIIATKFVIFCSLVFIEAYQ